MIFYTEKIVRQALNILDCKTFRGEKKRLELLVV